MGADTIANFIAIASGLALGVYGIYQTLSWRTYKFLNQILEEQEKTLKHTQDRLRDCEEKNIGKVIQHFKDKELSDGDSPTGIPQDL